MGRFRCRRPGVRGLYVRNIAASFCSEVYRGCDSTPRASFLAIPGSGAGRISVGYRRREKLWRHRHGEGGCRSRSRGCNILIYRLDLREVGLSVMRNAHSEGSQSVFDELCPLHRNGEQDGRDPCHDWSLTEYGIAQEILALLLCETSRATEN